ncbi:MAG TPA: TonB family protein [Bryobacteraceae bacterium]|jgi:TonB family protein|nr:TonB family protein [Bryobacteraceae bacterium]
MRVVVRPESKRLQSGLSFTLSACLHGSVLLWVAIGPLIPKAGPANLYDQEIRPNAHRLVWYNLRDRLPDISPSRQPADRRPPRANTKSPRTLVAGAKDTPRASQIIWLPAPSLETPQIVPSPNLVALTHPARPVRDFTPAEQPRPKLLTPDLPEAPKMAAAQPQIIPLPPPARPQPRAFTPPAEERAKTAQPSLPAAPDLTVAMTHEPAPAVNALLRVQPARRTFVPLVEAKRAPIPQPENLPDAPQVAAKSPLQEPVVPLTAVARAVRPFNAPEVRRDQPARPNSLVEAPAVSANHAPEVALAIVGLFPTRPTEIPKPKASQDAGFSAGPQPQPTGESAAAQNSQLVIPGLLAHAGPQEQPSALVASLEPPTSARNLLAAARAVRVTASAPPMAIPGSVPVPAPRGSRLTGRMVYSVAIQMPNVTSYSGSWIIWFAEREPVSGQVADVHPPLALRKVDPKYVAAAAAEKIEGKVRLAAVIRKDGHVDGVELLEHLDSRLDRSAQEAVSKWEFTPALRNGSPVDVDAVFEIPFHLAPLTSKK